MNNFWALVTRFRGYADGLVLWDGDVGATANVASTIAGAEDLLPVRYALGHDDLYTQLMNGMGGKWTVKRSLVGLFDGKTIPTFESSNPGAEREVDTSLESTYSKKNDPYIWAIEHYLKKGKTNANLMTYSIDPIKEGEFCNPKMTSVSSNPIIPLMHTSIRETFLTLCRQARTFL